MGRVASLRAVEPHLEVALLGLLPLGRVGVWPPATDDAPWDFFEIPAHSESALWAAPLRERVPRAAVPPCKHGNGCLWHPGASYGKIK